ncbi:hypothetical protein B4Q13_16770, partial [Lacticaseibacillus rhamnosus]
MGELGKTRGVAFRKAVLPESLDLPEAAFREAAVDSIDAVRAQPRPLVSLSDPVIAEHQELKRFLRARLYNHPKGQEVMDEARATLRVLFEAYMQDPARLPADHQSLVTRAEAEGGAPARARCRADPWGPPPQPQGGHPGARGPRRAMSSLGRVVSEWCPLRCTVPPRWSAGRMNGLPCGSGSPIHTDRRD